MPVKDTAQYLPDCLESITSQTHKNWELIAVDDHSTDESFQIIERYALADKRIKPCTNSGTGIIEALKTGYALSKGHFITRMDSDDKMAPEKLSTMLRQLEDYGKGHIATGLVHYFSASPLGDGYKKYQNWLNNLSSTGTNFNDLYKECPIPSPCWMVFRSDFEKCKAFNSQIYPEDYDLCFRFYLNGLQCIPADAILHYWRDYSNRTSRTNAHYSDNRFLSIKLHYFFNLHYNSDKTLVVWGAGKKGKQVAKHCAEKSIPFRWITNNEKKVGKEIYGIILEQEQNFRLHDTQIIVTIANSEEKKEVNRRFEEHQLYSMKHFFWFC